MSVLMVTELEQRLTNVLRVTTETLNAVTAERDKLKVDLENIWRQYELDMGAISDVIPYLEQIIAERDSYKADAELGRIAMRFDEPHGDYCDVDPAERICDEFYKAISDAVMKDKP